MTAIGGAVTAVNFVLALIVATRILRLSRSSHGPEAWLGLYFVLSAFLGFALSCGVYLSWVDPNVSFAPSIEKALHLGFLVSWSSGNTCLAVFTWKTFRRDSPVARAAVGVAAGLMFSGILLMGLTEGFAIRVLPGGPYWLSFAARTGVLLWLAFESFVYWRKLRRRTAIGLGSPLLANRFLLWGVWAATTFLLGQSDPAARLWAAGSMNAAGELDMDALAPMVAVIVSVTSLLGIVTASTLLMAFFPTAGYRRWVESRQASAAAAV